MRHALVGALVLALAFTPSASARGQSALSLDLPAAADGMSPVAFTVHLALSDLACFDEQDVLVELRVVEGASRVEPAQAHLVIPEGSYFTEPYRGAASATLYPEASWGNVTILATFDDPLGRCAVPGSMPAASATATIVLGGAPPPPPEPAPSEPTTEPAPTPTTEPSPAPEPTPATEPRSQPPPAANTSSSPRDVAAVGPQAGYIGDYDAPPQESRDAPGLGALGALVALVAVATLWRRSR